MTDVTGLSTDGIFVSGFNNSVGTQTGQPSVIGTRLYVRAVSGGFNLGVSKNSSTSTDWVWDPRIFTTNQTLFIVGSYTLNHGSSFDDVSKLWINPAPNSFGAAIEPATIFGHHQRRGPQRSRNREFYLCPARGQRTGSDARR